MQQNKNPDVDRRIQEAHAEKKQRFRGYSPMMGLDRQFVADFRRATDYDAWGQIIEAVDLYASLAQRLSSLMVAPQINLTAGQKNVCGIIVTKLNLRVKGLRSVPEESENVSQEELRELLPDVQRLRDELEESHHVETRTTCLTEGTMKVLEDDNENSSSSRETVLFGSNPMKEGKTYVSITVEKIGLKHAPSYKNPFVTYSIKDKTGVFNLAPSRDSQVAATVSGNHVLFDSTFDLNKPLEDFAEGFVVFFEFKHYKVKKQAVSTKCFSFIDQTELTRSGPLVIELYKKPTDYRRKNLNLLTSKPLYLHLLISVVKC